MRLENDVKICYNLVKHYIFGRIIYVNCRKGYVSEELNE